MTVSDTRTDLIPTETRNRGVTPRALGTLTALCLTLILSCAAADAAADEPRRIVALAPNVTEILFALDLGQRVVGVGRYGSWPPEIEGKPRLGGLTDPALERLVTLAPDLAILLQSEDDLARRLRQLGIPVLTVRNDSLSQIADSIVTIAERCGVARRGRELLERWRQGLEPRAVASGVRTVLLVGRTPGRLTDLVVAARGTFLHELLVRLGGVNVFADVSLPYPQIALEELVQRRPDVILELQGTALTPAGTATLRTDWERLPEVPAVERGQIFVLAGDHVLIPGPRLPQLYEQMQEVLARAGRPSSTAEATEPRP